MTNIFRHQIYSEISDRILENGLGALTQANMHAAFFDPGNEHWARMSIVNAAQAGELILKAAISRVHPLLIFQNAFDFDLTEEVELSLETIVKKGKSHDFSKLPAILWAVCGRKISDIETFKKMREMRNCLQHFIDPELADLSSLSLRFIYQIIDPILRDEFGLFAINYHEDHSIGYDHLVGCLLRSGIKFSIPDDFDISEISIDKEISECDEGYRGWLTSELNKIGKDSLMKGSH